MAFEFYRAAMASVSVGIAQASLDAALKYAQERFAFEKPIGSFQLVQKALVDMMTETEAARFLSLYAWAQHDKGVKAAKECALAKAYATEAGVRVTSKGIQIHGGYGLTEDYPLERYFRDARTMTIPDGTTQIMELIAVREVLGISAIA